MKNVQDTEREAYLAYIQTPEGIEFKKRIEEQAAKARKFLKKLQELLNEKADERSKAERLEEEKRHQEELKR